MANIGVFFISVVIVFLTMGESEGEKNNRERINVFLLKYEITEIIEIPYRTDKIPVNKFEKSERSFQITAFGSTFIVDLSIFYPRADVEINYVSKLSNTTSTFLSNAFFLHQGYIRNVNNSFALGIFSRDNRFRGYLITDEVFCIEPYQSNTVIIYRFQDVIFPGCTKRGENEGLDCTETRYFARWASDREPPKGFRLHSYNNFYDKYLDFYRRLRKMKAEAKLRDELKAPSTDKHDNGESESNRKSENNDKNKNNADSESEHKFYSSTEDYKIQSEQDSGSYIKKPSKVNLVDSRGKRKHMGHKSDKHNTNSMKEKVDEKDDDDDDEDDDIYDDGDYTSEGSINGSYTKNSGSQTKESNMENLLDSKEKRKDGKHNNGKHEPNTKKETLSERKKEKDDEDEDAGKNIKTLNDVDRFSGSEINVAFQKHPINIAKNSNETTIFSKNGSKIVMTDINNVDILDKWKEADEMTGSNRKQIVKRENKLILEPIVEAVKSDVVEALECKVQVIVSPSLLKKFDDDTDMAAKDILIQFALLNKIFLKLPLKRRNKNVRFTFHVSNIVMHGDDAYSPFPGDRANLEFFTMSDRGYLDNCLSIGAVNKYLRSGEFYDGFTPGKKRNGVCSRSGNTLLVSHGNERTPAPMAIYFAALMRGVTRAIGALDRDNKCEEGSYPNPMQVLQDYILAEKIALPSEYSIFTSCNVKEIEKVLNERACFYHVSQPLCGNAILDPGEECDCGPIGACPLIDICCNIPHMYLDPDPSEMKNGSSYKSCTLSKGSVCSSSNPCCTECKISQDKSVCYSGPYDCDIAICDGKSAFCPTGVEASNGMMCYTNETLSEPLVCKDSKCDQPLCSSFELEPCTCAAGSDKDCLYCCMKDGRCQAAGTDLELFPNKTYFLPDSTECMGGLCVLGKCDVTDLEGAELRRMRQNIDKRPDSSHGHKNILTLHIIFETVVLLLILFLMQHQ